MKILALDTSGMVASVAVWEDNLIRAEFSINDKKTHSQIILPMLEKIQKLTELDMKTVDAIAVAKGPGSFTGLRIGSATVKGLGFALDKPIISVPTLDGMAYNLYGSDRLICPILDARRSQVYTGLYSFKWIKDKYDMDVIKEQCVLTIGEIIKLCNEIRREVIFLGDGVPVFQKEIQECMEVPYLLAPAHLNRQRAGSVAALAAAYCEKNRELNGGELRLEKGIIETAKEHAPEYLRLSQAERERKERENS